MAEQVILVIDDDESHLEVTKELLQEEGLRVLVHRGAFGATERVMSLRPALVLLDVNMPALSGEGLARLFRERFPSTVVLLLSSNDEDALRRSAERVGAAGFVCKGDPTDLRRRVRSMLGRA